MSQVTKQLFVLICGCPRSGTTELVSFLNQHSDIYLGCERYAHRHFAGHVPISRSDFEPQRFAQLTPGDTFWRNLEDMPGWSSNGGSTPGKLKIGTTRVYGDKVPDLVFHLRPILLSFGEETRVLVCVRDLLSVARSWKVRTDNANDTLWSRSSGFEETIRMWSGALADLVDYQADGLPVVDIYIPQLYQADRAEFRRAMDFLGVEADLSLDLAFRSAVSWRHTTHDVPPETPKLPSKEERELIVGHPYIKTAVSKLRGCNYRIPMNLLFWPGFEAEFYRNK